MSLCLAVATCSKLSLSRICSVIGGRSIHQSPVRLWDHYDNEKWFPPGIEVLKRSKEGFLFDFKRFRRRFRESQNDPYGRKEAFNYTRQNVFRYELLPYESNFVIIGGGLVGSSIAFWLKQRVRDDNITVTVIECEDTFTKSSSMLSTGGLRQQYATPEAIEMASFTAEFLRNANEHLRIDDCEPPDIDFDPVGQLFLARTEEEVKKMEDAHALQSKLGVKTVLMDKDVLLERFPFMNFDDVLLGSLGLENEGVIDSWQILSAIREKNMQLGVRYVKAKVEGFVFEDNVGDDLGSREGDTKTYVQTLDDEQDLWSASTRRMVAVNIRPQKSNCAPRPLRFMQCVNAAGPWGGTIANMAKIGKGKGLMAIPILIEARKRYVFSLHCEDSPGLLMPYLQDPSGVWCHRDFNTNTYLCGKHPTKDEDSKIDHSNLEVDYDYFYEKVWPVLSARIPALEKVHVKNAWAGYIDVNTFDNLPIIGAHPLFHNFFNVCGFNGHGISQAIPVGRACMEKFMDAAYKTIPLNMFNINRVIHKQARSEM